MFDDFVPPYSLDTHPCDDPAVRIADLEYRLVSWLTCEPDVLSDLLILTRENPWLRHVAKTLARMRSLHAEFSVADV
jgi:hypothetical protein